MGPEALRLLLFGRPFGTATRAGRPAVPRPQTSRTSRCSVRFVSPFTRRTCCRRREGAELEPHASKQPDILPTDPKAAGSAGGANLAGSDVAPRLSRTRLPPPPSITIPPKAPSGTVDGAGPMAGAKVAS